MAGTELHSEVRARAWLPAVAVLIAAAVPFLPLLQADFVNWDDDQNFVKNESWRGLSAEHLRWMFTTFHYGGYHPLSWLSVAVDHAFWGMNPRGYHLTNILLHALNSVLVFALFVQLQDRAAQKAAGGLWIAAVVAVVFAVHPLRVESVAWITERRGLLATGFLLGSVLCYLRAARSDGKRARRRALGFAVLLYVASMLSKGLALTFPFVLLLLDVYPLRRWPAGDRARTAGRLLLEKLPFVAVAAVIGLLAREAQLQAGAVQDWSQHDLASRTAQAAYSLAFYPWRTLVPVDLCVLHPLFEQPSWSAAPYLVAGLVIVGVTALLIGLRRRWPAALTAWLAYGMLLTPVSGLVQAGPSLVAERYSYLAMVPLFGLLAAAVSQYWQHGLSRGRVLSLSALAAVVIVTTSSLSWRQGAAWQDSESLWTQTLAVHPECLQAHLNLGAVLAQQERREDAVVHYRECVRLRPDYGTAWYQLGLQLLRLRRPQQALEALRMARGLTATGFWTSPAPPAPILYSMAHASHGTGDVEGAIRLCRESLLANPAYSHASVMLADLLIARDERPQAKRVIDEALRFAPTDTRLQELQRRARD